MRTRSMPLYAAIWVATAYVMAPIALAETKRLTNDGQLKLAPLFVKNGREVVYSVHYQPRRVVLMRLRLEDGSQEMVLPQGNASQFDADLSPDERFLVYSRSGFDRQLLLVIMDRKKDQEFVFSPPGTQRSTVRTPRFTRDTTRVLFTLNGPGGQQIASVNRQAKDLKKLTTSNGANGWPALSPDGRRIVFSSSRNGPFDLYSMDADGNNVKRLTRSKASDLHASWSPDGKQIAFTSSRDGNYEVYVMNADGKKVRRITNHPERDDYPIWHPDGKRLLTVAERKGKFDLYLTKLQSD